MNPSSVSTAAVRGLAFALLQLRYRSPNPDAMAPAYVIATPAQPSSRCAPAKIN